VEVRLQLGPSTTRATSLAFPLHSFSFIFALILLRLDIAFLLPICEKYQSTSAFKTAYHSLTPQTTTIVSPLGPSVHMLHKAAVGFFCLSLSSAPPQGQGGPNDPKSKTCLFNNHRTIVVGDTLFVHGGEWASDLGFIKHNNCTALQVTKWQTTSSVPHPPFAHVETISTLSPFILLC